jgi:uncharacterized protein
MELLSDPAFIIVAIIAVLITGIAKGGFGGMALLAVPLMSLVISPVQAAGIMLPIMIPMDIMSIWIYRKTWDASILKLMLPSALIGITCGWMLAGFFNDDIIRLTVGLIAVSFIVHRWRSMLSKKEIDDREVIKKPTRLNTLLGIFWGACSGFTSFLAHAGAPPYQAYVIPKRLDKKIYAGTSVIFFGVGNLLKLIPYGMLGQFSVTNLTISLLLLPLVPVGVLLGVRINRRIDEALFYKILMTAILLVGIKLIYDFFI